MYIAVVDNSKPDADKLIGYIKKYFKGDDVTVKCVHFDDGMEFLECGASFDLVFLEAELPYRDGFQVAESLREFDRRTGMVFCTKYVEGAIKGYEYDAIDYILKPLDYENFSLRFKNILRRMRLDVVFNDNSITVKTRKRVVAVRTDDIIYVEVSDHCCVYHLVDNEIRVPDRLSRIAEKLAGHNFEYCNACYLVNLKYVSGIEDGVVHVGATSLKMSRARIKKFSDRFVEYISEA